MPVYQIGKVVLERLPYRSDLIEAITNLASDEGIKVGIISVIGAVTKVKIGYYDQATKQYSEKEREEPMEICSCLGNISMKEGKILVHAHIALADKEGRVIGGHLYEGATIFAAECLIQELQGENLERFPDEETGLFLWPRS